MPFRVRGTQVRVLKTGPNGDEPVVGTAVYRLPTGEFYGAQPLSGGGEPFRTDPQGYLQGRGILKPGDQLVAELPLTTTDTYSLYLTSAEPNQAG